MERGSSPDSRDERDDADEVAFDEFLGLAERGAAPPVAAFLDERGLGQDAELRSRLETLHRAASAARPLEDSGQVAGSVGPYRILDSIGSGGFGLVYLAEQLSPVQREVALKVLRPGMDSSEILDRFEAEKSALSRMDHPGIANVLDAGTTDSGRPFFAMEYVPGEPITRFADASRLTVEDRLRLFALVCDAVQHAHQKGVLHRDLKPSNVLVRRVDGRPRPKVIDFGVAKALDGDVLGRDPLDGASSPRTRAGALVGTLEYMAPEQASGALTRGAVDSRADIYSLGVLLYELLSGRLPIEPRSSARASGTDVVRALLEGEPLPLDASVDDEIARSRRESAVSLKRTLSGELDWIVQRALEKDPERRYASASELALDLRRYLDDEPVLARPHGLFYRLKKLASRHRGAALGAGV
ncbi:MAG: serine/threonine-protein kinase, partial [Planctomycetota bacterium]